VTGKPGYGRPKGAANHLTRQQREAAQSLVARHGDPLEAVLEIVAYWKRVWHAELKKSEANRNDKRFNRAEERIIRCCEVAEQYIRPKFQHIAHRNEGAPSAVIIAPPRAATSEEWLKANAPKNITLERKIILDELPGPTLQQFVPNVRAALDVADKLGEQNAQPIIDQAKRFSEQSPQQQAIDQINRKYLNGY
jgi:hypothetical protein